GALRAGAFAMARPERVDRLILEAFTFTGKGSPTLTKRREGLEYFRTHHRRPRDRDMIRSIFTRDKPGTSDPAVAEALADAELPFGDSIPTGTYRACCRRRPTPSPDRFRRRACRATSSCRCRRRRASVASRGGSRSWAACSRSATA